MRAFEAWLLCRVAHTVEAGEVSADLLSELRLEVERARDLPQEAGHALAVQDIAERVGFTVHQAGKLWAGQEAQPTATQELPLPQITLRAVPIMRIHRLSG